MPFVDFETIREKQVRYRILPVAAWGGGSIRLNKLTAAECIELINLQDDIEENENGKPKDPTKNVKWAVEVCARTIADESGTLQYDTAEGRDFLGMEYKALNEILPIAVELLELDDSPAEKKST